MSRRRAIVASPGIAIGPVFRYRPVEVDTRPRSVENRAAEVARYNRARDVTRIALQEMADAAEQEGHDPGIFEIQIEFLDDPTYGEAIGQCVADQGLNAEACVESVSGELVAEFEELEDEYFQQRSVDIQDLATRLIRTLNGVEETALASIDSPCILVARDLAPTDTAGMRREMVLGICTEVGSATSHTAIIARAMGIPALVGVGALDLESGDEVVVDAIDGQLIVAPDAGTREGYAARRERFVARRAELLARAHEPAVTADGDRVEVAANIGSGAEARMALEQGAEGVGLLRTEFLFLGRPVLPDEDEQYRAYAEIARTMGDRPLVIRTLDVGGDKELPSIRMPEEANPFLGERAIRLAMAQPDRLLVPQLRALLRAAHGTGIHIMFPMVARLDELARLRAAIESAQAALATRGVPFATDPKIGIMIEIPAAAIGARHFARDVDFFSIGTNDLTQYTLAADRTNERVAPIADYFDPSVIELIARVIEAGHAAGKWVGMCGEMAGDPLAIPLLLGLGLDEFSMSPASIPEAKATLRMLSREACRGVAERCLASPAVAEVREILRDFASRLAAPA